MMRNQRQRANSVDPDEVAHKEPPHLDLPCLQIQSHSFLACEGLITASLWVFCSHHKTKDRNLDLQEHDIWFHSVFIHSLILQ